MSPISARFAPGHEVHSADTLATQRTHSVLRRGPKECWPILADALVASALFTEDRSQSPRVGASPPGQNRVMASRTRKRA